MILRIHNTIYTLKFRTNSPVFKYIMEINIIGIITIAIIINGLYTNVCDDFVVNIKINTTYNENKIITKKREYSINIFQNEDSI
jgi:hypothetical protein